MSEVKPKKKHFQFRSSFNGEVLSSFSSKDSTLVAPLYLDIDEEYYSFCVPLNTNNHCLKIQREEILQKLEYLKNNYLKIGLIPKLKKKDNKIKVKTSDGEVDLFVRKNTFFLEWPEEVGKQPVYFKGKVDVLDRHLDWLYKTRKRS